MRALNLGIEPVLSRAGYAGIASPLTGPLVTATPSETEPLASGQNYVAWLADATLDQIRAATPPAGGDTLLFALLRHSLLRVYASTAVRIARARGVASPGEGKEPGLGADGLSAWERLSAAAAGGHRPGHARGASRRGSRRRGAGVTGRWSR